MSGRATKAALTRVTSWGSGISGGTPPTYSFRARCSVIATAGGAISAAPPAAMSGALGIASHPLLVFCRAALLLAAAAVVVVVVVVAEVGGGGGEV